MDVCVDDSITKRGGEFTLHGVDSNRKLAYVGDAKLTLHLANVAFERGYRPEEYQALRSACTSDKCLSRVYDALFDAATPVIVRFGDASSELSIKQKATFVEALLESVQDAFELQRLYELILCDQIKVF